jgi:hypothetical protein
MPQSSRFTRGFLVVTPGLTIKDRLRVLQARRRGEHTPLARLDITGAPSGRSRQRTAASGQRTEDTHSFDTSDERESGSGQ